MRKYTGEEALAAKPMVLFFLTALVLRCKILKTVTFELGALSQNTSAT